MGNRATQRRTLGHSSVEVTVLGLGTAPLGGLFSHVEDDTATAVIHAALDAGLTYVDTAPLYGHGVAERRVGAALAPSRLLGRPVLDAGRSSCPPRSAG